MARRSPLGPRSTHPFRRGIGRSQRADGDRIPRRPPPRTPLPPGVGGCRAAPTGRIFRPSHGQRVIKSLPNGPPGASCPRSAEFPRMSAWGKSRAGPQHCVIDAVRGAQGDDSASGVESGSRHALAGAVLLRPRTSLPPAPPGPPGAPDARARRRPTARCTPGRTSADPRWPWVPCRCSRRGPGPATCAGSAATARSLLSAERGRPPPGRRHPAEALRRLHTPHASGRRLFPRLCLGPLSSSEAPARRQTQLRVFDGRTRPGSDAHGKLNAAQPV